MKALEITVKIGCPVACSLCPQSKIKAAYSGEREFTLENFGVILSKVPKDCQIDFSGMTEPLIHPFAGTMIEMVSLAGFESVLFTTLVGLNPAKVNAIKNANLKQIRIHVPDEKAMVIPDDKWIALHDLFLTTGKQATYMAMGPMTNKVAAYMAGLGLNVELPTMLSRVGNLGWNDAGRPLKGRITCAADRYFQNVVLPNGQVVGCCHLYSMEIILGNLLTESYDKIHERAVEWSKDLNPPENSPCRACAWAKPI